MLGKRLPCARPVLCSGRRSKNRQGFPLPQGIGSLLVGADKHAEFCIESCYEENKWDRVNEQELLQWGGQR